MENKNSENPEWVFNGKDSITIEFNHEPANSIKNTIKWKGEIFHFRISPLERVTINVYTHYAIIYNKIKYYPKIVGHYAGGAICGDKPPVIESGNHILEIMIGLKHCTITERIKPIDLSLSDEKTNIIPDSNQFINAESKADEKIIYENPFEITEASDKIVFDTPKEEVFIFSVEINQVTLYENSTAGVYINNYAYFENGNFVVDQWKLGSSYEDEKFIVVNSSNLHLLYKEFGIKWRNKARLLVGVLNAFKGKDCFKNYEEHLKLKNIPYGFTI